MTDDCSWADTDPTGTGNSFAALGNAFNVALTQIDSALGLGTTANTALTARSVAKPAFLAIDPSIDAVFPISTITSATTPTVVSASSVTSLIGNIGTPDAGDKTTVAWYQTANSGVTALFITVYSVSTVDGSETKIFTSADLSGVVVAGWNYYNFISPAMITTAIGNWYAVELMIEGAGTAIYSIAGLPSHWLPANINVWPQSMGASRTSLATVAFDAIASNSGLTGSGSTTVTVTKSFTAAAGADVFVFASAVESGGAQTIQTFTATYGGTSMSVIATQAFNATTVDGLLKLFRLAGAGTGGALNVVVNATTTSGTVLMTIQPMSYTNVTSVSAIVTNATQSGSLTDTTTGVTNGLTLACLAGLSIAGPPHSTRLSTRLSGAAP